MMRWILPKGWTRCFRLDGDFIAGAPVIDYRGSTVPHNHWIGWVVS